MGVSKALPHVRLPVNLITEGLRRCFLCVRHRPETESFTNLAFFGAKVSQTLLAARTMAVGERKACLSGQQEVATGGQERLTPKKRVEPVLHYLVVQGRPFRV